MAVIVNETDLRNRSGKFVAHVSNPRLGAWFRSTAQMQVVAGVEYRECFVAHLTVDAADSGNAVPDSPVDGVLADPEFLILPNHHVVDLTAHCSRQVGQAVGC